MWYPLVHVVSSRFLLVVIFQGVCERIVLALNDSCILFLIVRKHILLTLNIIEYYTLQYNRKAVFFLIRYSTVFIDCKIKEETIESKIRERVKQNFKQESVHLKLNHKCECTES